MKRRAWPVDTHSSGFTLQTKKTHQVKPARALGAAPFPCQNKFSSPRCKRSRGQGSHAFQADGILFWAFALAAKGKQPAQIPAARPRGPTEERRSPGDRLSARVPRGGTDPSPTSAPGSPADPQGPALGCHPGLGGTPIPCRHRLK